MFPLTQHTILLLLLVAATLLASIATWRSGWGQRTLLWAVTLAAPFVSLWLDPPVGEFAGLAYLIVGMFAVGALVVGGLLGLVLRHVRPPVALLLLAVLGLGATGFELGRQHVPSSCLERPLPVRLDGIALRVPAEMQARIERRDEVAFFGRQDRKYGAAALCRETRNGNVPIDVDTLWITPVSSADRMAEACDAREGPIWCEGFRDTPYRHIGKIILSTDKDRTAPIYYWEYKFDDLKLTKSGDLSKGELCLQGGYLNATSCWSWEPFDDGDLRVMVETWNVDPVFQEMPPGEALQMASDVNAMVRQLLKP